MPRPISLPAPWRAGLDLLLGPARQLPGCAAPARVCGHASGGLSPCCRLGGVTTGGLQKGCLAQNKHPALGTDVQAYPRPPDQRGHSRPCRDEARGRACARAAPSGVEDPPGRDAVGAGPGRESGCGELPPAGPAQVPVNRLGRVHPESHGALPHPLSGLDLQAHAVPHRLRTAGSQRPSHPGLHRGPQQERPHGVRGVWAPQVTLHLVQPPGRGAPVSKKSAQPGLAQRPSGNTPRKHRSQIPSILVLLKNSSIGGLCRWGATPTPSAAHTPAGSWGPHQPGPAACLLERGSPQLWALSGAVLAHPGGLRTAAPVVGSHAVTHGR